MKVCATYGSEMHLRNESSMHEIRLDVFKKIPRELNDESIITLCGKNIKTIPEWFNGMVDVGDNDVNTEMRTIRSMHDFQKTPNSDEIIALMKGGNHISKGAFMVRSLTDLHNIFKASGSIKTRHVLIGMGTTGEITRIRSSVLGNEFTFGYCGKPTAPGQTTAEELEKLGDDCTLVGIIGETLAHSKSPHMQNAAMKASGIKGKYLVFETPDLNHFRDVMTEYDIRGMNVTVPFKEKIISNVDRCSKETEEIGAVNTVINDGGILTGENTDTAGIEAALSKHVNDIDKVLILGSGGAARATAYVSSNLGKEISVTGRNHRTVYRVSRDFGGEEYTGDVTDYDIIVNCTPIGIVDGMYPIRIESISNKQIVFDMVYGKQTRLMETAINKGCRIIKGKDMLVAQGAESFKMWFGKEPDVKIMRCAIQ